jgi:hypothetical protein
MMSSDSPTGGKFSGLACRTLWSSTQESGVDEVSEFTGVILHLTSQEKKRVEGSVFGKCKASIIAGGVSLTWDANAKFVVTSHLPPIIYSV